MIMKDFDNYLHSGSNNLKIALTDRSFRKVTNNHTLKINNDLATLGDAVYCLALTELLMDHEQISKDKQTYESDESLVTKVAEYYHILDLLRYDKDDVTKGVGYNWIETEEQKKKKKDNPQKYLATAMEALMGAYYLDRDRHMGLIIELAKEWMQIIDRK